MLQRRKLSKHFIYNWLKEDLYGEFTIYTSPKTHKLTKKILDKIWFTSTSFYSKPNKTPYITGSRPRYMRFISLIQKSSVRNIKGFKLAFNKLSFLKVKIFKSRFFTRNYFIKSQKFLNTSLVVLKNVKKLLNVFFIKHWLKTSGMFRYRQNTFFDKSKKKFIDKSFLHLNFENSLYVPKVHLVKRKERPFIFRYHMLRYFNLVEPNDFANKNLFSFYYSAKKNMQTYASKLEFQLSTLLIRSSFIENAYVADHLAKRKLFLVNGQPSLLGNATLNVWDIVTPSSYVWWFVFSRFYHFTKGLVNSKRFYKSFFRRRRFFSRFKDTQRSPFFSIIMHKYFQETIYLNLIRSWVLSGAPSYMELSYKLLSFVIYRNAYNRDLTSPFSISSLKSLVQGHNRFEKFSVLV